MPAEVLADGAAANVIELILIEGGKATAGGAEAAGVGTGAAEVTATGLGAMLLPVLAFLAVLLAPSSIAPEPEVNPPAAPAKDPVQECSKDGESAAEQEATVQLLTEQELCEKAKKQLKQLKATVEKTHPMDTGNAKKRAKIPCSYITRRLTHMQQLKATREEVQKYCFPGSPEKGHETQMAEIDSAIENYKQLKNTNCAPGHPMENV